jgi:acetolactate synthase-1/2/3 large subunit
MPHVGDAMIDAIASAGVRRLYTVPGESFLEVLDAADRHEGLRQFSTRHESGASFMADADAKISGIPAVAMATRGPGAANLSIGVHTAHQDGTPMLVLIGDVETPRIFRGAFQEVDLPAFYRPITKAAMTARRGDRLPEMVTDALRIAVSGRPGPVMISLPADLLAEEFAGPAPAPLPTVAPAGCAPETVRRLRRTLAEAQRPVVIAGAGIRHATDRLVAFCEAYRLGVYSAMRRQDVFPNDHPLYLGHLGVSPASGTVDALREADVVLVLGAALDQMTTQQFTLPAAAAHRIHVDADPLTLGAGLPVDEAVVAEPRELVEALLAELPAVPDRVCWERAHQRYLDSTSAPARTAARGCDPGAVIEAMKGAWPAETIVTSDAGNFSGFLHQYWRFTTPCSQAAPINGAMGYAVPGAVGAKAAAPDRPVVGVVGDGGFLMTGNEVETAVRYGLPLTIVVLRNGLYGTIAMHQAKEMGRLSAVGIGEVDLAAYARSLGAQGLTVEEPGQLDDAMRTAADSDAVTVVDVVTDPDLITATGRLSEMFPAG